MNEHESRQLFRGGQGRTPHEVYEYGREVTLWLVAAAIAAACYLMATAP